MFSTITKLQAELRAAQRIPHSVTRLKEFSYLSWFVERLCFWAEFFSPSILFIPTRSLIHAGLHDVNRSVEKESYIIERMRHRARHVDLYILSCILVEFALGISLLIGYSQPLCILIRVVALVRILDIAQANINLNVFDRLRFAESSHVTVSVTRNLIIAAITYGELMLSFALLYATMPLNLHGIEYTYDCVYFSMATQLTIGYGDIHPIGAARYLATLQGFIGLFFSLLIVGRFVSLLPPAKTVFGDEAQPSLVEETHPGNR
jgi:hypothetical protein